MKPVQQLRPALLAYSISKAYGTPTPPLLVTFRHRGVDGKVVYERKAVKL